MFEESAVWVCALAFIGIALWLYFPEILLSPPTGIHFVRQTDTLSFIARFSSSSQGLFNPAVFDLRNNPDNGLSAAEFPILYWLLAFGYDGIHDAWHLRLVSLATVVLGHLMFGRACSRYLGLSYTGYFLSAWMMGSSVLVYYACNTLPDSLAYGTVLMAWSLAFPAPGSERVSTSVSCVLLFTVAGLLKATTGLNLIAYLILVGLDNARRKQHGPRQVFIPTLLISALGLLAVAGWGWYSNVYNGQHGATHFVTNASPIWSIGSFRRAEVFEAVTIYWWAKYLHPTTWHVLVVLGCSFVGLHTGKIFAQTTAVLLVLGSLSYAVLFFERFQDHDYYFLTVLPAVAFVSLSGLSNILAKWPSVWVRRVLLAFCLTMAGVSFSYSKLNLDRRYGPERIDGFSVTQVWLADMPGDLSRVGVSREARIVVLGDRSPNGSLLFLQRCGWTYPGFPFPAKPDWAQLMQDGATHVLIIDGSAPVSPFLNSVAAGKHWSLWSIDRNQSASTDTNIGTGHHAIDTGR